MLNSQMLKGILEGCILSVIQKGEVYGYELSQKLEENGFQSISEGSIYPLLSRMQKDSLIEGIFKDSNQGPKRKYYYLTEKGNEALFDFEKKWDLLKNSVDSVLR